MIDINKYADFFHDGSIIDINHINNKIIIFMKSAEMDEEDINDILDLSKDHRICGKLHIEDIKNIQENNQLYNDLLKMKYEDAEIFHFKINPHKVELQIKWSSYYPKPFLEDFSTIKIEAEKIWWENAPN